MPNAQVNGRPCAAWTSQLNNQLGMKAAEGQLNPSNLTFLAYGNASALPGWFELAISMPNARIGASTSKMRWPPQDGQPTER